PIVSHCFTRHRHPPSFPTRRSSDLQAISNRPVTHFQTMLPFPLEYLYRGRRAYRGVVSFPSLLIPLAAWRSCCVVQRKPAIVLLQEYHAFHAHSSDVVNV